MESNYKIATTFAGLTSLNQLATPLTDPRSEGLQTTDPVDIADGSRRNVGWLRQEWHWGFLSEAQCEALRAYIGVVYVRTRKNDGNFETYSAVLVWPEQEPEHYAGKVIDITVELRMMEVATS